MSFSKISYPFSTFALTNNHRLNHMIWEMRSCCFLDKIIRSFCQKKKKIIRSSQPKL